MPANFGDNNIICSGTGTFSTLATDYFTFPKVDGSVEQSLVTDGAGNIIFSGVAGGGSITDIFDDKSPQLGGNLDLNSSDLTGTGDILITGSGNFSDKIQANSFIKDGGTSSQFLKADGSISDAFYVQGIGNNTTDIATWSNVSSSTGKSISSSLGTRFVINNGMMGVGTAGPSHLLSVSGTINATTIIKQGGTSDQFLKANGDVDGNSYQQILSEGAFVDGNKTKLDAIEASADVTDATNVDAAGAVMNSDSSTASMSFVIDEDSMSSDSATKVPTQQSVKAYVDTSTGSNLIRGSFPLTAPSGSFNVTGGYNTNTLDVYKNGIKLFKGSSYDFTETGGGTSFDLTTDAQSGDLIEYVALNASTNATANTSLGSVSVTSSQSIFNTSDTFTSSSLAVFLNGVKLVAGVAPADYEVTSISQFTLNSPAAPGDIVDYVAYGATVASSNLAKTGDTMTGNLTVDADLIITGYVETHTDSGNSGASQTIDISSSTVQTYTLTGNCTFTMPAADAGRSFTILLKTGAGSFTATFTGVKFPSNAAPTITVTGSRMDIITFVADGTNWYGNVTQDYYL